MSNYNKVILIGNLTRDVEIRYTPNTNNAVASFGIAVNRKYKDQEETTFVDLEAWGSTAENISKYFSKGDPILIEGRLKLDQWQDQNGGNRSKLKVVAERFEFVGGKGGGQRNDEPNF